jgi:two-component system response regulator HydG
VGFREDLFHRFNEFTINVLPLREYKDDIEIFADHFLSLANKDLGKNILGFTKAVHQIFKNYYWHGNLRELNNMIRRAALLTDQPYIDCGSLPIEIIQYESQVLSMSISKTHAMPEVQKSIKGTAASTSREQRSIKEVGINAEYQLIIKVLTEVKFNKVKAAKILNIDRKTLYNKLEEYQACIAQ